MKPIEEKSLTEYLSLKESIYDYASDIACFVRDNDERIMAEFKGTIKKLEIDEALVLVTFAESWPYGGYDSYSFSYPTKFLTMEKDEVLAKLEKTNIPVRQQRILAKKQSDQREREVDLAKFKELKKKLNK